MLPPTTTPIPKERLLRDLQVTTHDDHESKIQKVGKHTIFLFASGTFFNQTMHYHLKSRFHKFISARQCGTP